MPWNQATRPHYNRDQLRYPSDLTPHEFAVVAPYLPAQHNLRGRPRQVDLHEIINALSYWLRSGCQWRMLPKDFPRWKTVYSYYWRWCRAGIWQHLHQALYSQARVHQGRNPEPTAAILDAMATDKKRVDGRLRFVLPQALGDVVVVDDVAHEEVIAAMEETRE